MVAYVVLILNDCVGVIFIGLLVGYREAFCVCHLELVPKGGKVVRRYELG